LPRAGHRADDIRGLVGRFRQQPLAGG
jgi:hypothetical protein